MQQPGHGLGGECGVEYICHAAVSEHRDVYCEKQLPRDKAHEEVRRGRHAGLKDLLQRGRISERRSIGSGLDRDLEGGRENRAERRSVLKS